jgi:hypothetical protein
MTKTQVEIPIEKLGLPGITEELIVLDKFDGDGREDDDRRSDCEERIFNIQARLSKYPEANEEISCEIDPEQGGSGFLVCGENIHMEINSSNGPFKILPNNKHQFSVVSFSCKAHSPKAVTPFIDYICFKENLPLFLPIVVCEDPKNNIRTFDYIPPFPSVAFNPHQGKIINELCSLYALYREAKNTYSPYYKFLCYFKILEGIYKYVRPKALKKAKEKGIELSTIKEVVPSHSEIDEALEGQRISTLFHDRFTKSFRDKVAHYILDSGSILNVSDYATSKEFSKELKLLEICTRIVLQTQEKYCSEVE